jgi:hypothetical protein
MQAPSWRDVYGETSVRGGKDAESGSLDSADTDVRLSIVHGWNKIDFGTSCAVAQVCPEDRSSTDLSGGVSESSLRGFSSFKDDVQQRILKDLVGVWLPSQRGILSNRLYIQDTIQERDFELRYIGVQVFIYSPNRYNFDKVLVVPFEKLNQVTCNPVITGLRSQSR